MLRSDPEVVRNFTMGVFNNPGGPPPLESEDCLTVNVRYKKCIHSADDKLTKYEVYAPSTPAPPGGRTVMFWIYGGGFRFGTAGIAPYSGASFAAYQDVVLVAANYRTNG